ncbi:GTP-binding protein Rheb isoform X1 [Symphalangus syndactylus]|uniref:GTP-binding protein Rheb isoform X1 n=1 Tax=Symphalangus syndactylus TaxID=9590 RepID=UPI0030047EA7
MPQSKSRKIAILGYRSVGKSSLTIQFVEGQFVDSYDPTIENTFTKLITVNGQEYHLQLVDTAGQDEYSIFPQTYSIDINGYILVYSVTSIKSFEVIKVIHGKLLDMVGKVQIPIMLVGNKKDLHMERVISYEEGKALAESWNAAFLESSAKENQVTDSINRILHCVVISRRDVFLQLAIDLCLDHSCVTFGLPPFLILSFVLL